MLRPALLFFALLSLTRSISPTAPIVLSPNTESSPGNFMFTFQLASPLATTSYLLIVLSTFSTTVTPTSCLLLSTAIAINACANLNTANSLTINTTVVNSVNPNIAAAQTVAVSFGTVLSAGVSYSLQIITGILPSIGAISQSYQLYVMSGTGVMIQENWNSGQIYFQKLNNNVLQISSINDLTTCLPATTVSNLLQITIRVGCPTPTSRLMFTINQGFEFTLSSLVTMISVIGAAPQLQSMTVVSSNRIMAVFNEQFVVGRTFRLTISNILTPQSISSGYISVYSLPANSLSPLELYELSINIKTVSYNAPISILLAQGISPTAPMEFYISTIQYITITIQLPRNFNSNFVLLLTGDTIQFQEGTIYAKTSTVNTNTLKYYCNSTQSVTISGFSLIPSGSVITVTARVWISSNPVFTITASIDTAASILTPIIYGTVVTTASAQPVSIITGLTGSQGESNKLTSMQTTTSSLFFTITPSFVTYSGAFLNIYTSPSLQADSTFASASSCLVNATAQYCTVTSTSAYTIITIASNSSYNLYPQSQPTSIAVNQIKFSSVTSSSSSLMHLYFQLTVFQTSQAAVKKQLIAPMVVPQRNQLANFVSYFSNDFANAGSSYINLYRLVSSDPTEWQNVIQFYQKRVISVFAQQGWSNLHSILSQTLSPGDPYPCLTSLAGTTFTYNKGTSSNSSNEFPLGWDRLDIVLPGGESSSKFSIIIPTTYLTTLNISYQILVGKINTLTGAITYLNSEPMPVLGAPTYRVPVSLSVTAKTLTATQLNIAGKAGSYASSIPFTVVPSSLFSGNSYSTCVVVVSSWAFFDFNTALASASLSSVNPVFANVEQTPMSLKLAPSVYLTVLPFKTAGVYASSFNIMLNGVKLPYSLDLPNYSVFLIDQTGTIDSYNTFINQNQGAFYSSYLSSLQIGCNDNSLGVINTYCTITFTPYQDIDVSAQLILTFTGMSVATQLCTLTNNASVLVPNTCSPSTDRTKLTVVLNNANRLAGLGLYTLIVNGMSISASAIVAYVVFSVMDSTGSSIIETATRILMTEVAENFPIYINQVNYAKNNPIVNSALFVNFTLPRSLNADESLSILLSNDFSNLNGVPSRLRIYLYTSVFTLIPTSWILNSLNSMIIFEGLQGTLQAATYSLEIYGIITPSVITQSLITIIFKRNFDNTYAKTNVVASTAQFPSLTSKVNSLITFQSFFNTEGFEHEMVFTVNNQYAEVNSQTVWVITLPRYYSQPLWNDNSLTYCTINSEALSCQLNPTTPYQIMLSSSPLIISRNAGYTISIYGINCPRATYLNGNSHYVTQNIFFGTSAYLSAPSYTDYSELFISSSIINPQTQAGYGSVVLTSITSSNMQVYQTTFFTLTLTCSVAINPLQWIFMTFPVGFDNFNGISFVIQTQYPTGNPINTEAGRASVVINRRIGYQLLTLTIPASTSFQIVISSLMTPRTPQTIDMNKLQVIVASSDRSSTTAASLQLHNLLSPLTFTPSGLYIAVNNNQMISLTAGTYSLPIPITPSDNTTFLTNMLLTFVSNNFQFNSNPTYLYLGSSKSTFTIGADQNLIPTSYSFTVVKKQTSISALYTTQSIYAVQISSVPVNITVPTTITVPLGGCSLPIYITLPNAPYSGITLDFSLNTTLANSSQFWVNEQLSYNSISFTTTTISQLVSFCSDSSLTATQVMVSLLLGGANAASYYFTSPTITINIIASPAVTPSLAVTVTNAQKTYANIAFNTNIAGLVFYQLSLYPLITPIPLTTLKSYIKSNTLVIQSELNYQTYIYSTDLDHRVGFNTLTSGANSLNIEGLLPQRIYTLCAYFENQFRAATNQICTNWTMASWGVASMASVTFTQPILANQLNNMLCFFVKASSSQIGQIVTQDGDSCSLNTSPTNYNYSYSGTSITAKLKGVILYHMPSTNLTTDGSISAFNSLFGVGGLTAAALTTAQSLFSVNYIQTSVFLGNFDPIAVISTINFAPTVSYNLNPYSNSNSLAITGITSASPATIYFILVPYKSIVRNLISGTSVINIHNVVTPSPQQIANCQDGSYNPVSRCYRVVIQSGNTYSVTFNGIISDSVYLLFKTTANEYPIRPVFYGGVGVYEWNTVSYSGTLTFLAPLLVLLIVL